VNSLKVEICSLRPRNYTQNPDQSLFGSPEDDAFGRDFTINSLFYNINQQRIEDYTKQGLFDLKSKLIRTPLASIETLMADPLRCMRAIRFSSKLRFELTSDLKEAIKSDSVQHLLKERISKERIWIELEKILRMKHEMDVYYGIDLIVSLNLTPIIFREFPGTKGI
jgi:tRNA nucleotidyltransferase (CCA-adding enzyme)